MPAVQLGHPLVEHYGHQDRHLGNRVISSRRRDNCNSVSESLSKNLQLASSLAARADHVRQMCAAVLADFVSRVRTSVLRIGDLRMETAPESGFSRNHVIIFVHAFALLAGGATAVAQTTAPTGNTVKYHATINDVKYVYGTAEPVVRLKLWDGWCSSSKCRNLHTLVSSGAGSQPKSMPTNCRRAAESYGRDREPESFGCWPCSRRLSSNRTSRDIRHLLLRMVRYSTTGLERASSDPRPQAGSSKIQ